jgi:hypothetical protein
MLAATINNSFDLSGIMVVNLNFFHVLPVYNGDNLYPFLFSIFLNDLEDFFRQLNGEPLKIIQEKLENGLHIF